MRSRLTGTLEHLDQTSNTPTATIAITRTPIPDTNQPATTQTHPPHAEAFDVLVPVYVAERLEDHRGRTATLHTIELLEAQGQGSHLIPRLIGFTDRRDRDFFNLFTTVKNLGPRKALRAMTIPPGTIAAFIAAKDTASLKKLPGIGPRLAETIVAELAGKADRFITTGIEHTEPKPPASARPTTNESTEPLPPDQADACAALVRLGTPRPEAERRVAAALEKDPALAQPGTPADRILAAALAATP